MFSSSGMLAHFAAVYDPEEANRLSLQLSEPRDALAAAAAKKG